MQSTIQIFSQPHTNCQCWFLDYNLRMGSHEIFKNMPHAHAHVVHPMDQLHLLYFFYYYFLNSTLISTFLITYLHSIWDTETSIRTFTKWFIQFYTNLQYQYKLYKYLIKYAKTKIDFTYARSVCPKIL